MRFQNYTFSDIYEKMFNFCYTDLATPTPGTNNPNKKRRAALTLLSDRSRQPAPLDPGALPPLQTWQSTGPSSS